MKLIIDDCIPYIKEAIGIMGAEALFVPGREFTPALVRDADALIVRTRTRCDRALLEGSRVQLIATATIGFDHIDADYCRQAGIAWTNASGSNAASVAQYIESSLIVLKLTRGIDLRGRCMGIVGVGNVGSRVAAVAREHGMRVLLNDPPRAKREGSEGFSPLERLMEECDIISFHVPLDRAGRYKTFHLADDSFFRGLKRKPVFINTSRGEVADTAALADALAKGCVSEAIIDVWENEPNIDSELLGKALIATPHIAGYSADGKANATRMSLDALCSHFHIKPGYRIAPPEPLNPIIYTSDTDEALLRIYDPRRDSEALKASPQRFEQLRGDYPLRREKEAYTIKIL